MFRLLAVLGLVCTVGLCADLGQQLDKAAESRRLGRTSEALQIVQKLRKTDPAIYDLNNLAYLEAVLLAEEDKQREANSLLAGMRESDFPLQDGLLVHLIENASTEEFEGRAPYFEDFLANHTKHPQWYPLALDYAALLARAGRRTEALTWYERLSQTAGARKRTAKLRLAELLAGAGPRPASTQASVSPADLARAKMLLKDLLGEKADDNVAGEAALILHDIDQTRPLPEKNLAALAVALIQARRPVLARTYLRRVIEGYPQSREQDHYHYLRARCTELEEASKAPAAYEAVYERYPSKRWGIYGLYRAGSIHLRSRRYPEAAAAFRRIVHGHRESTHFAAAVIDLSEALIYQGDRLAAEDLLEQSLAAKPGRSDRSRFLYHLARVRIEQAKWADALESLDQIKDLPTEQLPSGVTAEETAYWRGVCLENAGADKDAAEAYQRAASGQRSYFSYLAASRLPGVPLPPLTEEAPEPLNASRIVARPLYTTIEEKRAYQKPAALLRVEELLFLRLYDEAYREMRLLKPDAVGLSREDYLFHLANWAVQGGLNWESMNMAEQLHRLVAEPDARNVFSKQLIDLLYPRHYWDVIERYARRSGVDPILVLAIIRQESGFVPKAVSSASARGLLQIMPPTGRELARRAGIKFSVDRLFDPVVSIQLGCMFLKDMIDRYDGQTERALAAYNGGPGNADRWSKKLAGQVSGHDPSLFVSNIGFRETKQYVLKVTANYQIYKALLEQRPER